MLASRGLLGIASRHLRVQGRPAPLAVAAWHLSTSAGASAAARRANSSAPAPADSSTEAPVAAAATARPVAVPLSGGGALAVGGGPGSLAELSDQAGFLPRPDAFDERLKPGFRGGRALFIFFLCNAMPFGALLYYLREQRASRAELSLGALPSSADDVAAEVLRVMRTSNVCFLVQSPAANTKIPQAGQGAMLRVDPHSPELTAFVPPTEPLPLVPQLERNDLTDLLESPPVPGLGFVHFAINRSSPLGAAILAGHRQASLLYVSSTRGAYCTVGGQLSVLSDPESRRRYWKSIWASAFPPPRPASTPATPSATPQAAQAEKQELPPAWESEDYLLLRFAVSEANLQASVDGPQRWDNRRVLRKGDGGGSGPEWVLAAPPAF